MSTQTTTLETATTWNIDPIHSVAEFKVRHMMISNVKGQFTGVKGQLTLDEADITKSKVEASIDATTINTNDADRDTHLKSADFFDAQTHPELKFVSTSVTKKSEDELKVAGDLTMHGVTKPVVFVVDGPTAPGKDPWGNTKIGLVATTKVNRKEFGLTWNSALETGGVLVGEDVTITLELQLVKA